VPICDDVGIQEPLEQICQTYEWVQKNLDIYEDSVVVNGSLPFMRTDYFLEKLDGLEHFDGFSPRWIFP
jgi:hypothetical protein